MDLSWIRPTNKKQAVWITRYRLKQGYIDAATCSRDEDFYHYAEQLKAELERDGDTAENREIVKKTKNAWNNYSKRQNSYSVSIPNKYAKKLKKLAREYDLPINIVVQNLINEDYQDIDYRGEKIERLKERLNWKNDDIKQLKKQLNQKNEKIELLEKQFQEKAEELVKLQTKLALS